MSAVSLLWRAYGHVYDGLMQFWPYRYLLDLAAERLDVQNKEEVLDLGCGTGNMIEKIVNVPGVQITGVDGSASMLESARKKLGQRVNVKFSRNDIKTFTAEAADQSYDKIVMVNVLYAIPDRQELWANLLRILKPGGRIVITTSEKPGSGSIIREHFRNDSWRRLVSFKLAGVFVIDALINLLGRGRHFPFSSREVLAREIKAAGGRFLDPVTCYGGVNVLFSVERSA